MAFDAMVVFGRSFDFYLSWSDHANYKSFQIVGYQNPNAIS